MFAFAFLLVLLISNVTSNEETQSLQHYCNVEEPIHFHSFDFTKLSSETSDNLIRLDQNNSLRIHFCKALIRPCNGKDGYAICFNKSGQEIGAGKEPPAVDLTNGKITFKYQGDSCNATHNYSIDIDMKCNYMMGKETSIDIDILDRMETCHFHLTLETQAACTKRKQIDCSVKDSSGRYNLNALTDFTKNYEFQINDDLSVILNVCHSLLYGSHHVNCSADSSICLIDRTNKTNIKYSNIGNVEENTHIFIIDRNLLINYDSTTPCFQRQIGAVQNVSTTIKFICDLNATNSVPEYVGGMEYCHYKFIWRSIAACSERVLHDQSLVNQDFCTVKDPLSQYEYDLSNMKNHVFHTRTMDATYSISVCSFQNETVCKTGSGVCKLLQDSSIGISGGMANGKLMWKESGPYLNYTDGNICSKGVRKYTIIAFLCAESDWLDVDDKPCHTTINWYTKMVCKKPCAMSIYDMNFERLIRSRSNYVVKTKDGTEFHMNVCRPLVHTDKFTNCSNEVGICKVDKFGNVKTDMNLGYPDQNLRGRSDGTVVLSYKNGALCEEDTDQRISSQITFVCDLKHVEGSPRFIMYHNCTYYFEWRTKMSCGVVNGTLNDKCQVTNEYGDYWNLSKLSKKPYYEFQLTKFKETHSYIISFCGSRKICDGAYVCDQKMNYGMNMTVTSDYRKNLIKFHFTNGSKCADGSNAQSILSIKCNESVSVGDTLVLSDQYCNTEFEWSTNAICKPQNLARPTTATDTINSTPDNTSVTKDKKFISKTEPESHTFRTICIILLLIVIIVLTICYFHRPSRRALCMIRLYHLFRRCTTPCLGEYPEPTDHLCL